MWCQLNRPIRCTVSRHTLYDVTVLAACDQGHLTAWALTPKGASSHSRLDLSKSLIQIISVVALSEKLGISDDMATGYMRCLGLI
ncbi:hypothetical protein TNCV_2856431 [Trichonephila clavipes]|nr:hypothetical protein TNCV_2856431 [Trichonephila clavipes]